VRAIDRKLLRDLWDMRSQVLTVALVVGAAFSGFAGSFATYYSLVSARESFYESRASGTCSPTSSAPRGRSSARCSTSPDQRCRDQRRVRRDARSRRRRGARDRAVDRTPGRSRAAPQPAGDPARPRAGAGSGGEVVVSEGFANTRGVNPGDRVTALINGRKETLSIVGVGLSPEYIYATRGGAFPDDRSFGVLWMNRTALAAAYNMEGAFNHVSARLAPDASEPAVIAALDRLLEPYGGMSAHGRSEQISHRILDQEINQWKVSARSCRRSSSRSPRSCSTWC